MITNQLTNRQQEIALLIAKGLSNLEIAEELGITEGTCKNHVSAIYEGLGLKTAAENVRRVWVVMYVLRNGMINWYDWIDEVGRRKGDRIEEEI